MDELLNTSERESSACARAALVGIQVREPRVHAAQNIQRAKPNTRSCNQNTQLKSIFNRKEYIKVNGSHRTTKCKDSRHLV